MYDENCQGITVSFQILNDAIDPNNIKWQLDFTNPEGKEDEIQSWKTIYKIETRYIGFKNARIESWYGHYWEYMNRSKVSYLSDDLKAKCYDEFLRIDKGNHLNFIRKPALDGFLVGSTFAQAAIEAKYYSIPDSE